MEIHFNKICQPNCEHMEIVVSIWVKKEEKVLLHLIKWNYSASPPPKKKKTTTIHGIYHQEQKHLEKKNKK
jgi:hypothetical protein